MYQQKTLNIKLQGLLNLFIKSFCNHREHGGRKTTKQVWLFLKIFLDNLDSPDPSVALFIFQVYVFRDEFWCKVAKERVLWHEPFHTVSDYDLTKGKINWFLGGKLNVSGMNDPLKNELLVGFRIFDIKI